MSDSPEEAPGQPRRLGADWLTHLTPRRVGAWGVLAWLLYALPLMHFHGVTWDSPALFYAGERTLFWMEHPSEPFDFASPDPPGFHSRFEKWPNPADVVHYPVFPGLVTAISSQVFHDWLGLVDDIDGHHLGLILLHAIALYIYGYCLAGLLGVEAGLFATIALVLYPSIAAHAFNNAKDLTCADFYGCGLAAFGLGIVKRLPRQVLLGGVWVGLSLASKMNGVFALVTVALWLPVAWAILYRKRQAIPPGITQALLAAPYLSFGVFYLSWPWLYQGPLPHWWEHFNEYVLNMMHYGIRLRETWTNYPLRALLFMTPPLILLSALVYLLAGFRANREALATWSLLVLWTALPLLRIAAPHSGFFDANRHFLEYAGGLCAMAGAGFAMAIQETAAFLRRHGRTRPTERQLAWGASLTALATLLFAILSYAPYEIAYFNSFIGGLGGAQRQALFYMAPPHTNNVNETEGDYWGSSLRDFQRWLRAQNPIPATVGLCGVAGPNFDSNWDGPKTAKTVDLDEAEVVYVMPRQPFCEWRLVRALESRRPVLKRVEREGGLIYEILGPPTGQIGPPVSPPTRYDEPGM